jgi:hypothetical protein
MAADGGATVSTRADPALVKALARAFRYQRMLDEGRYASITEIATAEKLERGYLGTLLRLTLFAPDLVEAILDGRAPDGLTLPRLLEPFPIAWIGQRRLLAGDPHRGSSPADCPAPVGGGGSDLGQRRRRERSGVPFRRPGDCATRPD